MIDIENMNLTLKAKLLVQIMDLEDELERVRDDAANSLKAWEDENGPADAYLDFFFECFEHLRGRYPAPSVTSDADKQVIFDAIVRGEG